MFSPDRDVRLTAFVRCTREDGLKSLAGYVLRNQDSGILYHRDKARHTGDYDGLPDMDAILKLLHDGTPATDAPHRCEAVTLSLFYAHDVFLVTVLQ